MPELKLTLETVTPLFLGGADPQEPPELRPPAFRGAMRYWLRAALGGVLGDGDLDALRLLESRVFGSTVAASPISVRLTGNLEADRYPILPHKQNGHSREGGQRRAFGPDQTFDLVLEQPPELGSGATWKAGCAALNLMLTCGGVGLRSRRGYGTLRAVRSTAPELVPPSPDSISGWRRRVKEAIEGAVAAARFLARDQSMAVVRSPAGPAQFPCLGGATTVRVYDVRAHSAMDAVRQFMSKVPRNPAFGGISPRQASPLWVRPIATGRTYGLLFIILPSRFSRADYDRVEGFLKANFSIRHAGQEE
ncbi:MAG: type III-B CRISPR module RAMP protein Cmr1 [Anaerolineae bacterium]|nr:type III-B CRISPR module RAMP protein Cmr1 [Anaerolineae bacterium]